MSPDLEFTLIIFLCVAIAVTVLVGIFLVIWLVNLNKLTVSLTETTDLFKMELKPILSEFQTAIQKINIVLSAAGTNVGKVNKIIMSLLGVLSIFLGSFKNMSGGFLKGIFQGIKLFAKR